MLHLCGDSSWGVACTSVGEARRLRSARDQAGAAQFNAFTGFDDTVCDEIGLASHLTDKSIHATLFIVGDFDPNAAAKLAEESFGGWSADAAPPPPAAPAPAASETAETKQLVTARPGATQSEVTFGCLLPAAQDGEVSARHCVAAQVVQGRLMIALRQKMGATYGLSARAVTLRGGTRYLELSSALESSKLSPALAELKRVLTELGTTPVGAEELGWAKAKLADGRAVAHMTNAGVIAAEEKREAMGFPFDGPRPADEVARLTADELASDFQSCLRGRPVLSVVGDEPVVRAALAEGWR